MALSSKRGYTDNFNEWDSGKGVSKSLVCCWLLSQSVSVYAATYCLSSS